MPDGDRVLFTASYASLEDAQLDFTAVKALYQGGVWPKVSAAIVCKDDQGQIHVHRPLAAGKPVLLVAVAVAVAVVAVIAVIASAVFPNSVFSLIIVLVVIGVVGAAVRYFVLFAGGAARGSLTEAGSLLQAGRAALIATAVDSLSHDVDDAITHATHKIKHGMGKGEVRVGTAQIEAELARVDKVAKGG